MSERAPQVEGMGLDPDTAVRLLGHYLESLYRIVQWERVTPPALNPLAAPQSSSNQFGQDRLANALEFVGDTFTWLKENGVQVLAHDPETGYYRPIRSIGINAEAGRLVAIVPDPDETNGLVNMWLNPQLGYSLNEPNNHTPSAAPPPPPNALSFYNGGLGSGANTLGHN